MRLFWNYLHFTLSTILRTACLCWRKLMSSSRLGIRRQ
jgi:hypothetical protein